MVIQRVGAASAVGAAVLVSLLWAPFVAGATVVEPDAEVPPFSVEGVEATCGTSPTVRLTNNTGVSADFWIILQEPPLGGGGFGSGTVPAMSSVDFGLNQIPFDQYAYAISVQYTFDGSTFGFTEPVVAPAGCLLRPWQEILDSRCVGTDFVIEIGNYTTYGQMPVEVEGSDPVVVITGSTESAIGLDLDGDGFVSTKQTGPIAGDRPTVDVPFVDCGVPPTVIPDFDGDGVADLAVFRSEFGGWFANGLPVEFLGLNGDVPVPGDYDGDGVTERAVFRDGTWYVQDLPISYLGTSTDVPVPGDYDGDGDWEPAVFRAGAWFIDGQPTQYLGSAGDVPVPGDYDGDGATEVAVFRPSVGGWYVESQATVFFGLSSDVPVPGDFDGDGATEVAVFRPSVGGWYVDGLPTEFVGLAGDVPVPADYDGDGDADRAVFRPEVGGWYVQGAGPVFFGLSTDVPLSLPAAVYGEYFSDPLRLMACDGGESTSIGYYVVGVGGSSFPDSVPVGGSEPYTFVPVGLDAGFSMNSSSGELSHVDAPEGQYSFRIEITDAEGELLSVDAAIVYQLSGLPATC